MINNLTAIVSLTAVFLITTACNKNTHQETYKTDKKHSKKLTKEVEIDKIRWVDSISGTINEKFSFKLANIQAPSLPYQTCSLAKERNHTNLNWLNNLDKDKLSIASIEETFGTETEEELPLILMKYDGMDLGWTAIFSNLNYAEGLTKNIDRWETVDWCEDSLKLKKHNSHIINLCKGHLDNKTNLSELPIMKINGGADSICKSYIEELGPECFERRSCYHNFISGYWPQKEFIKRLE